MSALQKGLERYLDSERIQRLQSVKIGIAGLGGLGSNVALLLARSGISDFLLIDDDIIDESNLNRQCYFPKHVGMYKVDALTEVLLELNPRIEIEKNYQRLNIDNMPNILSKSKLWVEAMDDALDKRNFVELAMLQSCFTVSASGIAGYGGLAMQKKILGKYLVLVGDFSTDIEFASPFAPRVMQAAAMQADAMLEFILGNAD